MIIALDLDDVLANSLEKFIEFHNKNYGTSIKKEDFKKYTLQEIMGISKEEEIKRLLLFDESKFCEEIKPLNGAQQVVSLLSKNHELAIITSRPESVKEITILWLSENFPEIKKVLFTRKNYFEKPKLKAEICKEIKAEIIVEDNLTNALQCADAGIKVLLLDYPLNKLEDSNPFIKRVFSCGEIIHLI